MTAVERPSFGRKIKRNKRDGKNMSKSKIWCFKRRNSPPSSATSNVKWKRWMITELFLWWTASQHLTNWRTLSRRWVNYSQSLQSRMEQIIRRLKMQRIYNKVQTTDYIQEHESQIRFYQKTFKRVCTVLEKHLWTGETKIKLWHNEGKRKVWRLTGSWSETQHIIWQTRWRQCYCMSVYGCQWKQGH